MIVNPGSSRLRARTVAIPDPGPLEAYLTPGARCFLNRGDGVVALGEMHRFDTDSLDAADVWWTEFAESIENETELPGVAGTGPIAFGSFAFDPDSTAESSFLVVPEVVIGRRRGLSWLTRFGWDDVADEMPQVQPAPKSPGTVTYLQGSHSDDEWCAIVERVTESIREGRVEKVVLSRDELAVTEQRLDPRYLVERLSAMYPSSWTYLVDGMVGVSPVALLRVVGGLATSRVLTGTLLRSPVAATDGLMLHNALDRASRPYRTHQTAVKSVAEALSPFVNGMHLPEAPAILELDYASHLVTDITGAVLPETTALGLAAALHPTQAVAGVPMHAARDIISRVEGIDRGRYAGPIGWVDSLGNGEWAVAIRGGRVLDDHRVQLLAGVGIDADSVAQDELLEANAKFTPMRQALEAPHVEDADGP